MLKFVEEAEEANKVACLDTIYSIIGGKNLIGKKFFATEMNGLHFLEYLLKDVKISKNLKSKALDIMHDLIVNDDGMQFDNPTYVRTTLADELNISILLMEILREEAKDLMNPGGWALRHWILKVLAKLCQTSPDIKSTNKTT